MEDSAVMTVRVLFGLVDVLMRVLLVPSLTLFATHSVVHLPSVVLSVTCDTHLCKQNAQTWFQSERNQRMLLHFILLLTKFPNNS